MRACGPGRTRTGHLPLARRMLYPMSYEPMIVPCPERDSNAHCHRPERCASCQLGYPGPAVLRALGAIRTRTTGVLNAGPLPVGPRGHGAGTRDGDPPRWPGSASSPGRRARRSSYPPQPARRAPPPPRPRTERPSVVPRFSAAGRKSGHRTLFSDFGEPVCPPSSPGSQECMRKSLWNCGKNGDGKAFTQEKTARPRSGRAAAERRGVSRAACPVRDEGAAQGCRRGRADRRRPPGVASAVARRCRSAGSSRTPLSWCWSVVREQH